MTIATRAAAAKPEDTAGLLAELSLFVACDGTTFEFSDGVVLPDNFPWTGRFHLLLTMDSPESLLAAAMMLLPEGWETAIYLGGVNTNVQMETEAMRSGMEYFSPIDATASTPALALIAAIAQSKGV